MIGIGELVLIGIVAILVLVVPIAIILLLVRNTRNPAVPRAAALDSRCPRCAQPTAAPDRFCRHCGQQVLVQPEVG